MLIALLWWPFFLMAQEGRVAFSAQGGFYEQSFGLTLCCADSLHIRYTLNGEMPSSTSLLYVDSLFLDDRACSKSNIYTIVNTIPSRFYKPYDVDRAIVIRAAAFDESENRVGGVVTNTYLIKSMGCDLHGLPLISIVADSMSLFDYETGIFVPGVHYDFKDSTATGNYCKTGYEWEREANFEFYETDNSGINQVCGLRTHGGASRWYQQKGMKLYARREYSNKRFMHDFFGRQWDKGYKRLVLHPFQCSNWLQTGGQDYLAQRVGSYPDLDIDCLGVRQTVVFINGEYWGVYTLEESPDEHYLGDGYNLGIDRLNVIKWWNSEQHGDMTDWWRFMRWASGANLIQEEDLDYAFSRIDIPNFVDYLLFETFSANLDWPHNNVMLWQSETGEPFRFIFYDGDGCFTQLDFNALENAIEREREGRMIRLFLGNQVFRELLCCRYQILRETAFSYEAMKPVLDEYRNLVKDEIWRQSTRFGFPRSETQWFYDMRQVDAFLRERASVFENEFCGFMKTYYSDSLSINCK